MQIAKLVRSKLELLDSKGFNKEEHDNNIQKYRTDLIKVSISMIKININILKTYPELKTFITNYQ